MKNSSLPIELRNRLMLSFCLALVTGGLIAWASLAHNGAVFVRGWFVASVIGWLGWFALITAWKWAGGGRALAWLVVVCLVLRLGVGVGLSLLLPQVGYDEETQQAGYLFYDAHMRDTQAWELAQSDRSLLASFGEEFSSDQYGGLLSLSALIYRYFSPDAHRPYLVLLLASFAAALGVPFLWAAVQTRWSRGLALFSAWLLVLYPDGIFFSAAQMREPFMLGLIPIATWGVLAFNRQRRGALIAIGLSMAGMLLISNRVAVAVAGVLGVWFWLEYLYPRSKAWKFGGLAALAVGAVLGVALMWGWFSESSHWDRVLTMSTGTKQYQIEKLGEEYIVPFLVGYGVTQPLLPAALTEDTIPVWRGIIVARALGWWALLPMLAYALIAVIRAAKDPDRRIWLWLALAVFGWILISSARAGGDMTDNPRYRTIFLPWMAMLAAWAVRWAIANRDRWLAVVLIVEGIFMGFFIDWYVSRHLGMGNRLPFWKMLVYIVASSGLVVAGGLAWDAFDWFRRRRKLSG